MTDDGLWRPFSHDNGWVCGAGGGWMNECVRLKLKGYNATRKIGQNKQRPYDST